MAAVVKDPAAGLAGIRAQVILDLLEARSRLLDPDGRDPATSQRPSCGPDALELNAACLALPSYAREVGVTGTPLLWAWPWRTYPSSGRRRLELLQAAALLVAAVERMDLAVAGTPRLRLVAAPGRS